MKEIREKILIKSRNYLWCPNAKLGWYDIAYISLQTQPASYNRMLCLDIKNERSVALLKTEQECPSIFVIIFSYWVSCYEFYIEGS